MDEDGFVTEGASTNAWIVAQDGTVITRDLTNAILPGVTRRVMLEAMKRRRRSGWWSANSPSRKPKAAREAFISSATGAAVPVVAIDGVSIGNGAPER